MKEIQNSDKKIEDISSSKSGPENIVTKYRLDVECVKSANGSQACKIVKIETIDPIKVEAPEVSLEIPQEKGMPVVTAPVLNPEVVVSPKKTSDEKSPGLDECAPCYDIIKTAIEEKAAAAAAAAEKTAKVDAAAPRWLRRSPPEDRHRRMMKA
jgi:hypothetical protein